MGITGRADLQSPASRPIHLMIAAVERHFCTLNVPHRLEWLSDSGSAYIARQTALVAAALGIDLLFTPVRSPQSNCMSEAFVKTLKRDYASTVIPQDAETILGLVARMDRELL